MVSRVDMFDNLVVKDGVPVVVTGMNQQANFDKKLWSLEYLKKKHSNETVKVSMIGQPSDLSIRNKSSQPDQLLLIRNLLTY